MGRVLYVEATADREADSLAMSALRDLAHSLEPRPGWVGARLLRNTADPRVLLLELNWDGPEASLEGLLPILPGVKIRSWAFESLD